jgi:allophanate hydrolase subunit 2
LRTNDSLALNLFLDTAHSYSNNNRLHAVKSEQSNIKQVLQALRIQCQSSTHNIELIPSYQWNDFSHLQRNTLLSNEYSISTKTDRMAIKLQGPALKSASASLFSQGLSKGAVQCTGAGELIVMLNDRQTIGGYPVLGAVEAFSRAKLAQGKPGMVFQFVLGEPLNVAAKMRIWARQIENVCAYVDQCLHS